MEQVANLSDSTWGAAHSSEAIRDGRILRVG